MLARSIKILVLIIILFVFVSPVAAITLDFDGAEYTATTAEKFTVGWEASLIDGSTACADCEYEVRVYHVERKTYIECGKTTALLQKVQLPKTGHYWAEVRGCRVTQAERICSDWATSVNEADNPQVSGKLKKWRIYGRPASTGTPTIE